MTPTCDACEEAPPVARAVGMIDGLRGVMCTAQLCRVCLSAAAAEILEVHPLGSAAGSSAR